MDMTSEFSFEKDDSDNGDDENTRKSGNKSKE
jgi:hypothetical protein